MVSNVSADILSDNYGRSDRPGAPSHLCRWAGSLSGGALPETTRLLYSQPRGTTPHQPEVPNKPQSCTFCPHLRHLDRGDPHHTDCNSQAKRFENTKYCHRLSYLPLSLQQVDKCPPLRLLGTGGRACWSEYGCKAVPLRTSPRSPLRSNDPSHPSQTPMITLAPRRQRAAESRSKRPKESQNNGQLP